MICEELHFFYKQSVYKQLAAGWQIAKQLSGLNPFPKRGNKTFRLEKSVVFPSVINIKQLLNKQQTTTELSQKHYWENFKITDHKYRFLILKIIAFLIFIGYSVKLLSNH